MPVKARLTLPLPARPSGSLRQWLLGASVLAVLAGYGLILLAYGWLADLDRREDHRRLGERLVAQVAAGGVINAGPGGAEIRAWIGRAETPAPAPSPMTTPLNDSLASLLHASSSGPAAIRGPWFEGERAYLSSRLPLGGGRQLQLQQDVTEDLGRQQRNSLLLLAFAGMATLVSAALLRPVLDAGLRPLQALSDRMERIEGESLEHHRVPLANQPRELQRIARAFNDLLERLAASWERQRAFVNGVSHELRTPITLVAGYASRLRRRGVSLRADELEQLRLIEEEAARMGRMVTDLLDIARSDAGQLVLRREFFSVEQACRRVIDRLRPVAGDRLSLLSAPDGATLPALGDAERFEQCLQNLVENALKYSPPASPVLLSCHGGSEGLKVHVRDHGPGVPPEDRQRLLQRFQRGRHTGDIPGSGIGLAVVDTLMQAMGGRVLIGDAPGGGADFQLLLPRGAASAGESGPAAL